MRPLVRCTVIALAAGSIPSFFLWCVYSFAMISKVDVLWSGLVVICLGWWGWAALVGAAAMPDETWPIWIIAGLIAGTGVVAVMWRQIPLAGPMPLFPLVLFLGASGGAPALLAVVVSVERFANARRPR